MNFFYSFLTVYVSPKQPAKIVHSNSVEFTISNVTNGQIVKTIRLQLLVNVMSSP